MKKILLITLIILCAHQIPAWSADIVVLQSGSLPAYNSALQGFTSILSQDIPARGLKSIQPHTITSHILSEVKSLNTLRKQIVSQQPDLLLVIGSSSLSLVKGITKIPIIYIMVPYPELIVGEQHNITGINIHISAAQQLEALVRTIPRIKKIGLLYNPDRIGSLIKEAEDFARQNDLSLIALSVSTAKEVPGQLAEMKDRIDCLWMLPDRSVITPQTTDIIMLFSLENRIPVLTFSEKYLEVGAALSVSFDSLDMGKQAGELALQILNDTEISKLPPANVRKVNIRANHMAAKVLGINFEELINHE